MEKNNVEFVTVDVIVNYPRLFHQWDEPIEAIIRTYSGAIIHNLFAASPSLAANKAKDWISGSEHYDMVLSVRYWPEVAIYEQFQLM